jgi:transposase
VRCDAAGRAGCWLHRFLQAQGLPNHGVDSSSIEGNRRQRRAKSEGVDVRKLVSLLMRSHHGERAVWRVVHVPSGEAEDQRPLHRDLETLQPERARTTPRIQGLRSRQGVRLTRRTQLPEQRDTVRLWEGAPLPSGLPRRVLRVSAHQQCLREQMAAVEAERRALRHSSQDAPIEPVRPLMPRRGSGIKGAWVLWLEVFGWRALQNRREVGGVAGGTPTPYHSGERAREPGITKSGNRHVRWMPTEWAWSWRRYQPERALSCWLRERVSGGGKRLRRIGMGAVARKLRMALWRFLETGVIPAGADLKEA